MSILNLFKNDYVLGNNKRMRKYILPHNKRKNYKYVDDKTKTLDILQSKGISHPLTLGVIDSVAQINALHAKLKDASSFVAKPANGSMGNGIIIVESVEWDPNPLKTQLFTTRKSSIDYQEFSYYISLILSGAFSLGGRPDKVLFQAKIVPHDTLSKISYRGIPDVRVILFREVPVMAMIRLPSKESGGRGNLHQGAVGCGINLNSGKITYCSHKNQIIPEHPDFPGVEVSGTVIPHWDEILKISAQCAEAFPLTYIGVDVVVDANAGPVVLEVNARPGLSIQIANKRSLDPILEHLLKAKLEHLTMAERIQYAKNNFSS